MQVIPACRERAGSAAEASCSSLSDTVSCSGVWRSCIMLCSASSCTGAVDSGVGAMMERDSRPATTLSLPGVI